ncbi:hypothetical protein Tco_0875311 [Tanacetum coccineum]|uniref:Uncharacterized protein n=1 Tax=Tanacetum coccineum TaxID=301880 RepID=A0ABQ5BP84_9ASTR
MSDAFDELEAELDQKVFYVASNSELNVSRFTEMQKAHYVVKAHCLELEAELSNLRDNIHKDNYNELLNQFSNLEVNHLNLQLKYQNLKDSFQNKPSSSVNDTPDFNSVFVIGQMKASLQGKDNVIQKLKMQISQLKETRSELDRTLDFRARDFQISQLTEKVNGLQEQNELFRAENAKIKQHYKELYDSIKITRAKHTKQITTLKNENKSLKVQQQNTVSCVTTNQVIPNVLAPGKYAIDVEPIPPRNRNNREVHLVYLRHLRESVDTLREIVEEAKVERPLDRSLAFAYHYTKHSQELLEYVFGTCPKVFNQQDKKHAHTPRKKQVTFEDQIATSSSNTHKHVEPMHTQKSNVPVPPSTGVNSCRLVFRAKVIENQVVILGLVYNHSWSSAIAIYSDSSDESVGSPPSWVNLFGDIPTVIPSTSVVAPETSTIAPVVHLFIFPIFLCAPVVDTTSCASIHWMLFHHSYAPILLRLLILSDGPYSRTIMLHTFAVGDYRVTTRPSSSSEFLIAPVTVPSGIRRRSAILIQPREAIPFGRPYRTHLYRPRKLLTARKRVRPLTAHRLASRHASPRSLDRHSSSSSSSSDSSPVHSLGLDASDQAHSGYSTRDVPPRLCYPPRREPRRSEAFRHWYAASLSTLYPPTTSESSSGDSSERPLHSSSHSARPSCKRCRFPIDSVPSSMPVMGSLTPTRADLLPPRKRFKDLYSSEASIKEDTEIDPIETEVDIELGIGDGDDVRDHVEIDPRDVRDDIEEYEADTSAGDTVEVGILLFLSGLRDGIVRSFEDMPIDLDDAVRDFYHHMSEVHIDRIVGIETAQRRLEVDQLIARGHRVSMIERIDSLRFENLKVRAMLDIERDRVNSLRLQQGLVQGGVLKRGDSIEQESRENEQYGDERKRCGEEDASGKRRNEREEKKRIESRSEE